MRKILFVDHVYHRKTLSSRFFIDMLAEKFTVEILHVDPRDDQPLANGIPGGIDVVIVWQMDYVAPHFLAEGLPTIIVPMYDGSGAMPLLHWRLLRDAHFISFSFQLHSRLLDADCHSLLVKYFPEAPEKAVADFSDLRAFLWQRNAADISWGYVNHIIGEQLASLHVHDAPDNPKDHRLAFQPLSYPVTVSSWFEDSADLDAILETCNVYIAPRSAEGIGMAYLEAMARGNCVLANNSPTHNECIAHNVNGLLFDRNHGHAVDLSDAKRLGTWARKTVIDGRRRWLGVDCPAICELVETVVANLETKQRYSRRFIDDMTESYGLGFPDYTRFLKLHASIIHHGRASKGSVSRLIKPPKPGEPLTFGRRGSATDYQVIGLEAMDHGVSWCCAQKAEFVVPVEGRHPALLILDTVVSEDVPDPLNVNISINGERTAQTKLSSSDGSRTIYCIVPPGQRGSDTLVVHLVVDKLFVSDKVSTGETGPGLRSMEIYGIDEIPLRRLNDMEREVEPRVSSRKAHGFVIWCLRQGKSLYRAAAALEFSQDSVGAVAADALRDRQVGRLEPDVLAAIWQASDTLDHPVLGTIPFHSLLQRVRDLRSDVKGLFDVETDDGLAGYLGWYYVHGTKEFGYDSSIIDDERTWLMATCPGLPDDFPLTRLAYCVWSLRSDLQDAFDLSQAEGRQGMLAWMGTNAGNEIPNIRKLWKAPAALKAMAAREGIAV